MSMRARSGGNGATLYEPCPAISIIIFTRSSSDTGCLAAEVEDLPVRGVHRPRAQERVHHVVHEVEVALLPAAAEELDLLAEHDLAHEPPDEALARVADELARPVGVGEAQRRGADAVHRVVDQVVELAGDLVDAVHVRGVQQVGLVHGQALRLAVHLAGPGVDHLHVRVVLAHRLQDPELAAAVDLEVGEGVGHGVDVAHLAGEVEQHLLPADQVLHGVAPHVGDVDPDLVLVAGEVEEVAAVVGQQAVHGQDVGAEVGEGAAEVRADEPQRAGDHHLPPAIEVEVIQDFTATLAGAPRRCSLRTTSSSQSFTRSVRVRATRGTLKNWLRP